MRLAIRLVFGIAIAAFMISSDFRRELFDVFHKEAMKTVSKGLTPMSDIVAGMRGIGHAWSDSDGSSQKLIPPLSYCAQKRAYFINFSKDIPNALEILIRVPILTSLWPNSTLFIVLRARFA